jgi:hypothetical protein
MPKKSIAEKLIRKVELKLDGKTWPLVVTHNVLIECEELTGFNLIAGEVNLLRPSAKLVRALLYVVLRRAGAKYTLEQVGDLIHRSYAPAIAQFERGHRRSGGAERLLRWILT